MFEKTASCIYFVEYLRTICRDNGIQLPIDFIKVDTTPDAKNIRVTAMEGHLRTKRLRFLAGLPCWDKMVEQLKRFPKGRSGHDDYADTLALAVRFFTGEVAPVTPMSDERHPLLRAIEEQGTDITHIVMQQYTPTDNDLGDWFACD